ncbi:MAG: hypothetical protein DSY42_00130 [Aquifex sp.]|nr:MAG: hypothetical protein DSY42_00130 [Aquifex sp.]
MKVSKKSFNKAIELYTAFHWGKLPKKAKRIKFYVPQTFVYLGKLLAVIYLSDKDGAPRPYIHFFGKDEPLELRCRDGEVYIAKVGDFKLSDFPELLTDEEGKHLYITGFKGRVKEKGIVG